LYSFLFPENTIILKNTLPAFINKAFVKIFKMNIISQRRRRLSIANIVNAIEITLNENKLFYRKIRDGGLIRFNGIPVGEECIITVSNEFVNFEVLLDKPEEIRKMNHLLYNIGVNYKPVSYLRSKKENFASFQISVFPFNKNLFGTIFLSIANEFQRDAFPYDIKKSEDPFEYFLKEYRNFKSISEEEQAQIIEPALALKEKFFRNSKTLSGIYNKLYKVKKEKYTYKKNDNKEVNLNEFILIDFAALFRIMELNLLSFTLNDFFENFERGRKN